MSIGLYSDDKFTEFSKFAESKNAYLVTREPEKETKNLTVLQRIWKLGWPNYSDKLATTDIKDSFYLRKFVSSLQLSWNTLEHWLV